VDADPGEDRMRPRADPHDLTGVVGAQIEFGGDG
jgi:hypothetical protein